MHLSLLTVISAPPPLVEQSGARLCRAGVPELIQTCSFWGERRTVWLEKGLSIYHYALDVTWRWHKNFRGMMKPLFHVSFVVCVYSHRGNVGLCGICRPSLVRRGWALLVGARGIFTGLKYFFNNLFLIWVIHTWVFLIWYAYTFLNGGNSRWLWNFKQPYWGIINKYHRTCLKHTIWKVLTYGHTCETITTIEKMKMSSIPKSFFKFLCTPSLVFYVVLSQSLMSLLSLLINLHFLEFSVSVIIQRLLYVGWLLSLHIFILKFINVFAYNKSLFLFITE